MGQIFQLESRGVNQFDDVKPVVARPTGNSGVIDVVRDFPWSGTALTPYQVEKTPYVLLHEFDMTTNSAVSTFLYYKNFASNPAFTQQAGDLLQSAGNTLSELVDIASDNAFVKSVKDIASSADNFLGNLGVVTGVLPPTPDTTTASNAVISRVNQLSNSFSNFLNSIDGGFSNERLNDKYLQPYNRLYQRAHTGFKYVLPYTNPRRQVRTDFSDSPSGLLEKNPLWSADSIIGGAIQKSIKSIEGFASLFTSTSPGAFIEQPKYYSFGSDQEVYNVKFPLINTRDRDSYQKNFEFVFLLFYQNRAFRRSTSRVVPPKIYSARIPGITELPFCYISNISVEFIGNRRNVTIQNPGPEGGTINCIIPDAYDISIEISSLLEPTGNMMLSNELQSANYRGDPKQILQSIRNSVGVQISDFQQFLQPVFQTPVRVPTTFTEQLLSNPVISRNGIQTLSRLRGRLS